ncbi:MAG: hypothetical protein HY327_11070 [Chloroflexi bacterium]|nr:hypothetical protein [Chloroflexota bacterium]
MKTFFLCAMFFFLAACAPAATNAPAFGAAVPNQTAVHVDDPNQPHTHLDPAQAKADLQVIIVPSEIIVGADRFAVGLSDPQRGLIQDAVVHFHYYDLRDKTKAVLESEANATRVQTPDGLTTIFAHERVFDNAGNWGVEVQAQLPNGAAAIQRVAFQVVKDSSTKKPGDAAPKIKTLTAADAANDYQKLTSAVTPNAAFYRASLDAALVSGKPTVLLFSTPAFCQTRLCGPAYEIVSDVQKRVGDAVNWIHVEVFTGLPNPAANNFELAPAMNAFGLTTEPWVFLIDRAGKIAWRVEGVFTAEEVERHLKTLLP